MKFELPEGIPKERREIINSILTGVISKNSGEGENTVYDARPSRKFFIGTLSPRPTKEELVNFANKVSPPAIGLSLIHI